MDKKHQIKAAKANPQDIELRDNVGVSRRDFVKAGAAVGVGAAILPAPSVAQAQESPQEMEWNYTADVVVLGAGATGLAAAIRIRDVGLSVIVLEQNFDVGGRMLHSGGMVSLGGGDPVQMRDAAGEFDKEGFITVASQHAPEEVTEDPDLLFRDVTDWSVLDAAGQPIYRFNDRDAHRAWADNCPGVRQFVIDNYVRMGRIQGTQPCNGASRARRARGFLMLGDKTDIKAGTVTQEDAGIAGQSSSHFAPTTMADMSLFAAPNAVGNGAAVARPLEFSAREKGVQFMLNRHMDELIREQPFEGRALGVKASYTPRFNPEGEQLKSLWSDGNIEEREETVYVRARRAVVIGTGGHAGNRHFRSMFYPGMGDPTYWPTAAALLGERAYDASGIIAGMRVGANLAGMQHNLASWNDCYVLPTRIGTRDSYTGMLPGHPTFFRRGAAGIRLAPPSWEHLIAVNQVGKRFFNEMNIPVRVPLGGVWPGGERAGMPNSSMDHVQLDWRNCDPGWVRQMYIRQHALDAALQMNEGSTGPDYHSGPLWSIFDKGTIDRDGWDISFPFLSDTNGCFFTADTIEDLADKILGSHLQGMPLKYLAETVGKWNSYVDAGSDPDFERGPDAPMHKIDTPPFYAALMAPQWHDSYGGLKVNANSEVVDTEGRPIPGLYAGGEAVGGSTIHGLGRAFAQGFIAANHIIAG